MKVTFHYDESVISDVRSIDEFIKSVTGLSEFMARYDLCSRQVFMNRVCCEMMLDHMLRKVSDDSVEKVWWDVKTSSDWLDNAPSMAVKEVPAGELWVYIKE